MSNRVTYMVKGEERRKVYWSIDRRELEEDGWKVEGEEAPAEPKVLPEVEVGEDPFEAVAEEKGEYDLDEMTKSELLAWAGDLGHDLPGNELKSEILAKCKEIEGAL